MLLTLDVGNSHIHGGVFDNDRLLFQFRTVSHAITSDDLGIFLRSVLRENGVNTKKVRHIALCSVVPDWSHSIRSCAIKYFECEPFFLQAGVKTGLKIKYHNPVEVGSDRIANAIAATQRSPKKNVIIVDLGTATTFCAVTSQKEYLGGAILPGLRIAMESLESHTAKLPKVEIRKPAELIGRSTVESIQSGLYHGHLAVVLHMTQKIRETYFKNQSTNIIGTGGFARLYENESIFDEFVPELVLEGLHHGYRLNL